MMRESLRPDSPNPLCGFSVDGVFIEGDEKSIKAVREWYHSHTSTLPWYKREYLKLWGRGIR